jgi:hypothetical protein
MHGQCLTLVIMTSTLLSACSVGAPFVIATSDPVQTEEKVVRGVVNGLWRFDPSQNAHRLTKTAVGASQSEAAAFYDRYQVRVGIDRGHFIAKFVEVVPLPVGWKYSLDKIIDDGRTVNVGDVVDIRTARGSRIIPLAQIVRKCDRDPLPNENPDWKIGCKAYKSFNSNGYAGEVYVMTGF